MVLLAAGLQASWAFSLLGPVNFGDDTWQQTIIGYNPLNNGSAPPYLIDGLLTGPKNIGEEYRRNAGYLVYACDANFLNFFGSNGVVAVDQAYAILNNVFTNNPAGRTNGLDVYSVPLSEFPLKTIQQNYQATALELLDLKSDVLQLMVEQLGLADPVRYTWALHNRFIPQGATCTPPGPGNGVQYTVVMRNFDITASPLGSTQFPPYGQYSPYVNGVLYTYYIFENCGAQNASPPDVDALEVSVDPLANNPPVASAVDGLGLGNFYTGLTRDDVAGLRYLLSSNNIQTEAPASGALLEDTNNPTILVTTSDLGALVTAGQSNSPAVLAVLFPGVIASSTSYFTNILIPNVVIFTTNYVGEPFGTPPHIIIITNGFTISTVIRYVTTFDNVVTNSFRTNSTATLLTTTFGTQVGAPVGSPFVTKTTAKTINLTNTPTGDFYIIPAGSCGLTKVHVWQTNVIYTTNLIAFAINSDGSLITQSLVTYYTNHVLELLPCNFVAPTPRLYRGIQRLQFVRANFDSLLGQFFQPVTNTYSMVMVTNSHNVKQTFQRISTTPDFLFSATDFAPGPQVGPAFIQVPHQRNISFDESNVGTGLAGPGVINAPTTFTFNKVGIVFYNNSPNFLTGFNSTLAGFVWGSFDGTTNDPIVYPNGTSIANLMSEVLIQISISATNLPPGTLPPGTNGVTYPTVTLSVTGGQSPYSWALTPGSQLPGGPTLSPDGVISSNGNPLNIPPGLYNFTIQMTDAGNRVVNVNYSITIN
jgi:hypothetical protein